VIVGVPGVLGGLTGVTAFDAALEPEVPPALVAETVKV
jgi:hypothetical protein